LLNDKIEKKTIRKKKQKNNLRYPRLTQQTHDSCHKIEIT